MTTSSEYYTQKTGDWFNMLFVWLNNCSDLKGGCDGCYRLEQCVKSFDEIITLFDKLCNLKSRDKYNMLEKMTEEFLRGDNAEDNNSENLGG